MFCLPVVLWVVFFLESQIDIPANKIESESESEPKSEPKSEAETQSTQSTQINPEIERLSEKNKQLENVRCFCKIQIVSFYFVL